MAIDTSFLRKPRWLVGHVIALAAVILFVFLGMWQLRRHDERGQLDARLRDRIAAEPIDFDEARRLSPDALELRRVRATGTFDPSAELILQARSLNGRSGHHILTPLVLSDGSAVIVNRGWVPIDVIGPPVAGAEPPNGQTELVGIARKTEVRRGLGPIDPPEGVLDRVSRVDLNRISQQSNYPLASFYLQLVSPSDPDEFPLVLNTPEPGGGPPHLSYAAQWFLFAGVVLVGYPLLLRSTARKTDSARVVPVPETFEP